MIIVPYVEIDGSRTLSDSMLSEAYDKTVIDGTHVHVFYDGSVRNREDFIALMRNPANLPVFVFTEEKKMLGYAWINDLVYNRCFAHFNFFKESWGDKSVEMGKELIKYWFSFPGVDGPLLDVILGLTPSENKKAVSFIEKVGFHKLGEIPFMIKNAYSGYKESAWLSYCVR